MIIKRLLRLLMIGLLAAGLFDLGGAGLFIAILAAPVSLLLFFAPHRLFYRVAFYCWLVVYVVLSVFVTFALMLYLSVPARFLGFERWETFCMVSTWLHTIAVVISGPTILWGLVRIVRGGSGSLCVRGTLVSFCSFFVVSMPHLFFDPTPGEDSFNLLIWLGASCFTWFSALKFSWARLVSVK